jgi:hypothetical protein
VQLFQVRGLGAGFLPELAAGGVLQWLVRVYKAAGECLATLEGRMLPLDQEHLVLPIDGRD